MKAPEPLVVAWRGRQLRVRHDDPRLTPDSPRGAAFKRFEQAMLEAEAAFDEMNQSRMAGAHNRGVRSQILWPIELRPRLVEPAGGTNGGTRPTTRPL